MVSLSEDWIITDGKEHKIYVDANFDWSVKMEKAGEIEGGFIESFDQTQTGVGSVGLGSEQSVITINTKLSEQFDTQEKAIELTFTDRLTGGTVTKQIKFVKGFLYNGHVYHVLDGGEKSLATVRNNDRSLTNGNQASGLYELPIQGLATQLAKATSTTVWTSDLAWRTSGWTNADVRNVRFNKTPGYTLVAGKSGNGSVSASVYALFATATGTDRTQVDYVTLQIINTGITYTWYPYLLIQGDPASLRLDAVRYGGVGTSNYTYMQKVVDVYDNQAYVSNGTSRALPIANITGSSSYNAVKVYTRGGWANNNATESWISHQEWKDDNKNYAFRLDVTTGQNAQNEQHHVYFVKQVW